MFAIETDGMIGGGLVEWDTDYRLRHIATGYYLKLEENTNVGSMEGEKVQRILLTDKSSESSLFCYNLIYSTLSADNKDKQKKYLKKDSYFRLYSTQSVNLNIHNKHPPRKQQEVDIQFWLQSEELDEKKAEMEELVDAYREYENPSFSSEIKEDNVFKLAKANSTDVRMTCFLLSCMKILKGCIDFLSPKFSFQDNVGDQKDLNFQSHYKQFLYRMSRLEKCLTDLHLLCHNQLISYLYYENEYNSINIFIQNVLREQLYIEVLVKLLVTVFPEMEILVQLKKIEDDKIRNKRLNVTTNQMAAIINNVKKEKKEVKDEIQEEILLQKKAVCSQIFRLLSSICKNNVKNQFKTAKYVTLFAAHARYIPNSLNTIGTIMENFQEFLLTMHRQGTVARKKEKGKKKGSQPEKTQVQHYNSKMKGEDISISSLYGLKYREVVQQLHATNFKYATTWNLIQFFSDLIRDTEELLQKKQILRFLSMASIFNDEGINVNQETLFKFLIPEDNEDAVFESKVLIRIKSDGPTLIVFVNEQQRKLIDIIKKKNFNNIIEKAQEEGEGLVPGHPDNMKHKQYDDKSVLAYVIDQINFYSAMCTSRNYTWKRFVQNSFNVEALLETILDDKFQYEVRAIICGLFNKLYVDQEPRRKQFLPDLCKMVKSKAQQKGKFRADSIMSEVSEDHQDQQNNINQDIDPINVEDLKKRTLKYLEAQGVKVEQLSAQISLQQEKGVSDTDILARREEIYYDSKEIYNELTLQIIQMVKLLISFGKYSLQVTGKDESDIKGQNADFFQILQVLMSILEFEQLYPESRLVLQEQRKEKKKQREDVPGQKFFGGMMGMLTKGMGMFNIFSVMKSDDKDKKKQKKNQSSDNRAEDINTSQSFLQQSHVLKKIMTNILYDDHELHIEYKIKEQICDIFNNYLDFKLDFLLNNLKNIFRDYVTEDEKLFNNISEELSQSDLKLMREKFRTKIAKNIGQLLPPILETGTSVDTEDQYRQRMDMKRQVEIIELDAILGYDIFPSLVTNFCFTNNTVMQKKILNLMTRFFNQREELADLTAEMLIIFDQENIKLVKLAQQKLKLLAKFVDESEMWMGKLNDAKNKEIFDQVHSYLDWFEQSLYSGSGLDGQGEFQFITEDEIDPTRQQIMRHLQVYQITLTIIRDSIYLLEDLRKHDNNLYLKMEELFKFCFKFLRNFVVNNPKNQEVMSEYIVTLLVDLRIDLGQVELFCQIFRDNKFIALEKSEEVVDDFIKLIGSNGHQAKFLEFYIIIQRIKNEFLIGNQKKILYQILEPRVQNHIFYFQQQEHRGDHHVGNHQSDYDHPIFDFEAHNSNSESFKDEPYDYHAKLIEVLAFTSIGKQGLYLSEAQLRGMLPLRYLLFLLQTKDIYINQLKQQEIAEDFQYKKQRPMELTSPDEEQDEKSKRIFTQKPAFTSSNNISIPVIGREQSFGSSAQGYNESEIDPSQIHKLKIPILKFIYYTYLQSEKISDEFLQYSPLFSSYIDIQTKRMEDFDPRDSDNIHEEFYQYYFENFIYVINSFMRAFGISEGQKGNNESESSKVSREAISRLQVVLEEQIDDLPLNRKQKVQFNVFKEILNGDYENARRLDEEKQPFHSTMTSHTIQRLQTSTMKQREGQIRAEGEDEIWKLLWQVFLQEFLNSEALSEAIQDEHMTLAQGLNQIEELFKKEHLMSDIIGKNEIFKKITTFLIQSSTMEDNIGNFQLILQSLSYFIEIPTDENMDDLDEEEQEEQKIDQMENQQNFLNSCNSIYMIFSLLSDLSNPIIADEIWDDLILFGISILQGGNREVQMAINNYFQNFQNSQVFFMRFHDKLHQESEQVQKGEKDMVIQQTQQYQYNEKPDSILSMLRFMQLFAEGHYTELQQYLNTQYLNYHNYNLIQEVIDLLSTYFKFREQKYVENMTQCFDTLTEFIQGPCYENQRELVQDSFLELTKSLLDIDEIFQHLDKMENEKSNQGNDSNTNSMSSSLNLQQNSSQQLKQQKNQVMDMPSQPADGEKDQNNKLTKAISLDAMDLNKEQKVLEAKRKMQLPKYLIAKLQYKCSITLISLLEARKDNEIVNRMMKSLDIETITRNLSDCYYLFQEVGNQQYNPSLFLHFNIEPEKGNMKQIEQASFIIETGFNLYTVFSIFQEIGQDQEGGVKVEEEQEQESLLTNNIVGKIFKLSVSIVKAINLTIIEQAAKMKQMMMGTQKLNTEQTKNAILNVRANEQKQTMKFFQQNTLHIQILREDKLVEKTFFYCPPFCRALDKETKTNFNKDANRVSVQAKVTSIQLESEEIIQQMKHGFWLQTWLNQVKVMAVLAENIDLLRDVSFLMSISINIMIASRNGICQHAQRIFWLQLQLTIIFSLHKYTVTEQGITTTGTILIVLTTTIVSYFLAKTAPLLIMKAWVGVKQDKLNIFAYIQRLLMTVYYLLSDFYVLYYLIYGGTAILGVTYSAFFFFFQLFDVLVRYPVLLNVIQSVWIPQQSIAYTYFLFIVLMYCFTLFGYYQLRDSYPDGFCESTWICLVTAIDRSFKADGALGGYFHPTYTIPGRAHDTNYILVRYAFDNLYQIILMIVMVNIVSGIIIDTFGSLREELAEYLEDLETNCFICGYDSETIEKNSQNSLGFKYHIKNDHYQWNYVFYIAYLQDKDPTEYTGIQSYVADQVENDEIGWFPTGRALCLHQELEEDQNQIIIQSLQNILSRVKKIIFKYSFERFFLFLQQTDLEESIKYLSDQIEDVEAQNEDAIIDDQSQEGVAEK